VGLNDTGRRKLMSMGLEPFLPKKLTTDRLLPLGFDQ
jgi:hypothetical protein